MRHRRGREGEWRWRWRGGREGLQTKPDNDVVIDGCYTHKQASEQQRGAELIREQWWGIQERDAECRRKDKAAAPLALSRRFSLVSRAVATPARAHPTTPHTVLLTDSLPAVMGSEVDTSQSRPTPHEPPHADANTQRGNTRASLQPFAGGGGGDMDGVPIRGHCSLSKSGSAL